MNVSQKSSSAIPFNLTEFSVESPASTLALRREFYSQMYRIRRIEQTLLELFSKGLLSGTTHTSIGQEACAVGVVNALNREIDIIFSNHRAHGHFIAYCGDMVGLFGELMGKKIGVCGGIGGSQHLHKRNFYTNGHQGGIVPVGIGMALAEREKRSGAIVAVFLGDGTFGEGVVYEGFNIAALWKLPIMFVVEHNKYAQSTPFHLQHAGNLAKRAEPFGIESVEMEAEDVMRVFEAARYGFSRVRGGNGPFFLMLHTYRLAPHSKGDDDRSEEELSIYKARDPLVFLRRDLQDKGADLPDIEAKVEAEIRDALRKVQESDLEQPEAFLRRLPAHNKE